MRRARLQIKPNLGPRPSPGPRSQPSVDAAAPARTKAAAASASQSTVASHDGKQDHYTLLKVSESKSESALSTDRKKKQTAHSDQSASSKHESVGDGSAQSEPTTSGSLPRSPRKSVSAERSAVNDKSAAESQEHPVSPRKTVTASPVRSHSAKPPSSQVSSSTESPSVEKLPKPLTRTSLLSPVKGPLPRSRFGKVRPNLVNSGRNRSRASEANKESGPDPEVRGHDEAQGSAEAAAGVAKDDEELATAVADSVQSSQSTEDAAQPESDTTLPSIVVTATTEEEPESEAAVSDVASEISTPAYSEGLDESGESEQPLKKMDEKKKLAAERKSRRPKGALPPSDAPVDRNSMKMVDLIYWNPNRNHMKRRESRLPKLSASTTSVDTPSLDSVDGEASNMSDSLPVPQVKIGPDGNIVVNYESLLVENKPADSIEQSGDIVEEDEERFYNSSSFRINKKGKSWTKSETERFFRALQQVGTDFSLMRSLFPSRSRNELKNKFRKEEKCNRSRVDQALKERRQFDWKTFEQAKVEDEAENRRRTTKTQKLKKKRKHEAGDDSGEDGGEDEDEDEEDDLAIQEEMEEEERKENSQRNRRPASKILDGKDTDFPGYEAKKRKRDSASKHNREVVDILLNMRRGNVSGQDDDDAMSETSSIISEQSSVADGEERPFVPRVARQGRPRNPQRSSTNIIIESQASAVPDQSYQGSRDGSTTKPLTQRVLYVPCGQQTRMKTRANPLSSQGAKNSLVSEQPSTGFTAVGRVERPAVIPPVTQTIQSGVTLGGNPSGTSIRNALQTSQTVITIPEDKTVTGSQQALPTRPTTVSQGPTSVTVPSLGQSGGLAIPPTVIAAIEQLQTQNNNMMDVVLVEDQTAGQGVVHVYVVPRAAAETAVSADGGQSCS